MFTERITKIVFLLLITFSHTSFSQDSNKLWYDYYVKAESFRNSYDLDSTYFFFEKALKNFPQKELSYKKYCEISFLKAATLEAANKNEQALKQLLKLKKEVKSHNYRVLLTKIHINISLINEKLGYKEETFQNLSEAFDLINKDDSTYFCLPNYYLRLGSAYRIFGQIDSARIAVDKGIKIGVQQKNIQRLPTLYFLKAFLYPDNKTLVVKYLNKSLDIYLTEERIHGQRIIYNNLSSYYSRNNSLDSAMFYINKTFQLNQEYHYLIESSYINYLKSNIFHKQGRIDSAFNFLRRAIHLERNEKEKEKALAVKELNDKYQSIENKLTIRNQKILLENQKSRFKYLFLFAISVLLFSAVMVYVYRKIKRLNTQIFHQKDQLVSQNNHLQHSIEQEQFLMREVHHRVKNNLQLIINLIELSEDNDFNQSLINRIHTVATYHNMMYLGNHISEVNTKSYLLELVDNIVQCDYSLYPVDLNLNIESIKLSLDTLIPLGLIINELITNSLKYAQPNEKKILINISLSSIKDNFFLLQYSDNGIVQNPVVKKQKGFGFFIIETMVKQLLGSIDLQTSKGYFYNITFFKKNSNIEHISKNK